MIDEFKLVWTPNDIENGLAVRFPNGARFKVVLFAQTAQLKLPVFILVDPHINTKFIETQMIRTVLYSKEGLSEHFNLHGVELV